MKIIIVFDSMYGNTEKIARAVGEAAGGDVKVFRAAEANPSDLGGADLLVVGSPTVGGRPTQATQGFLGRISDSIDGLSVAAFDTRFPAKWARIFGYAAGRIAAQLQKKGGNLIAPPEAFFVLDKEGPLKDGEIERAARWASKISKEPDTSG